MCPAGINYYRNSHLCVALVCGSGAIVGPFVGIVLASAVHWQCLRARVRACVRARVRVWNTPISVGSDWTDMNPVIVPAGSSHLQPSPTAQDMGSGDGTDKERCHRRVLIPLIWKPAGQMSIMGSQSVRIIMQASAPSLIVCHSKHIHNPEPLGFSLIINIYFMLN